MLSMRLSGSLSFLGRLVAFSAIVSGLVLSAASACDTPVYRYAMYRWEPAPYEIYYFHDDPVADQAAGLHERIKEAARSEEKPANMMVIPVPLKEDPELKRIPPDVRQYWQEQEDPEVPTYMIVTPHGGKLHQGELSESDLPALLDSPARGEIAKQLEQGKAGVLVLLTGGDAAANDEAEKAAKDLIKDISDGKIEFYMPPSMFGPPGEEDDAPRLDVGFCRVVRDDPKEKWLVESLLTVESDLKDEEFVDQPMIFGVFGRGRALPPFVGKGINRDNLLDCVDFLTAACSCTVKDQNPGMDLLFAKDWWTAAENLATAFGAEEGNEPQFAAADFFPDLTIPAEQPMQEEEAAAETTTETPTEATAAASPQAEPAEEEIAEPTAAASSSEVAVRTDEPQTETKDAPQAAETTLTSTEKKMSQPAEESAEQAQVASVRSTEDAHASERETGSADQGDAFVGIFAVGGGIAVALVLLFGLTFFVLRPR
jgi:hypothetical protein